MTEPTLPRPELGVPFRTRLVLPDAGFTLEGLSVAGIETWLRIPEWQLAFDVGRAPEAIVRCRHLALTHGHMDHAGGLAQYLALRRLYRFGHSTVYAPAAACADLRAIVEAWQRLHGRVFEWTLVAMAPGDEAPLGGNRTLRALPVEHVVPALGYAVIERSARLKPDFRDATPDELRELSGRGVELTAPADRVRLAVSGDTRVSALERAPELRTADVALIEATFLDGLRKREDAHKGGHIHLDEIAERAELVQGKHFVPYHISQIYSLASARRAIAERLPPELAAKTTPLLPDLPTP